MNQGVRKIVFIISVLCAVQVRAQSVVVNSYINFNDPRDEWTELLVIDDNVNMANWTIRDNNATQNSWQTPVRFNNIPLWQHLRRGTVIMLWHRDAASSGTAHPVDVNPDDGYIEVGLQNTTYFTGGAFGSSPGFSGATMNLASPGDIIEIRTSTNVHVHGLGHYQNPSGTDWDNMSTPKLNHYNGTSSGDAIYACPGDNLAAFNGPQSVTQTARNNSTITFGLPNICIASLSGNRNYWLSLRNPDMTSQTVVPSSIVPGMPGSVTFSWLPASDPYSSDNTIGYIILRNTVNSFAAPPDDGTTYSIGSVIGGATVVGEINNSTITTFTDNTVMNGNKYYYRVYAFRYYTDNLNGNSYDAARGRAYNENQYVFVDWPFSPLPVEFLSVNAKWIESSARISWTTASETNNDFFDIERSTDGQHFETIGKVKGSGNSTALRQYEFKDYMPADGLNYYRIRQNDFNGQSTISKTVVLDKELQTQALSCSITPNPFSDKIFISINSNIADDARISLIDLTGKLIRTLDVRFFEGTSVFELDANDLKRGVYFFSLDSESLRYHTKLLKR